MDKKIFLYVIAGLLVLGILVLTFFPNMIYAFGDAGADGEDKCVAPEGMTQEAWEEHMSHHPNIYSECLS